MLNLSSLALLTVPIWFFQPAASAVAQTPKAAATPRNVAILIYPGVELLDFAGPGEVFSDAGDKTGPLFKVFTVALSREPIMSMDFVQITPQFTIADCPKTSIVVVPGGNVPSDNPALVSWVKERSGQTEIMMSVCNGALLYGNAGLLEGLEVTTHKSALQHLAMLEPTAKVFSNRRYVDNGHVVTSAGISAGIDGALHLVARLHGDDTAWNVARHMEYDWRPDEIAKLHEQPGREVEKSQAAGLAMSIAGLSAEAALAKYKALATPPPEAELNKAGYALLNAGKQDQALALLRLAVAAFPTSSNASDSLSEAFEISGDAEQAKWFAKQTLGLLEKEKGLAEKRAQSIRNAASSRLARLSGKALAEFPFVCGPCGNRCDKQGFLEGGPCPGCSMPLEARSKTE